MARYGTLLAIGEKGRYFFSIELQTVIFVPKGKQRARKEIPVPFQGDLATYADWYCAAYKVALTHCLMGGAD